MVFGGSGLGDEPEGGRRRRSPYSTRGRSGGVFSYAWVILGVVCGVLLVILGLRNQHAVDSLVGVGLIAVCVLLSRPVRQGIARKWAATRWEHPDTEAPVVIYWRADDLHSLRMRSALADVRDRAVWVNLFWWGDGETTVRRANDGDEPLPYVVIDKVPYVDPIPDLVRDALADLPARPRVGRRKATDG